MLEKLQHVQARLRDKPQLLRRGRLISDTVLLRVDGDQFYLHFDKGALATITPGPSMKIPYQFGLSTDAEALHRFWTPTPPPGFHDIFAMAKIGRLEFSGDILVMIKNLMFFKEVLLLGREGAA